MPASTSVSSTARCNGHRARASAGAASGVGAQPGGRLWAAGRRSTNSNSSNTIHSKGHFISVPGWKARDSYLAKMGLKAAGNEIGYVLLEIHDGKDINVHSHVTVLKRKHVIKEIDCEEDLE